MCGISICLFVCAVCDLKNRTIPVWILGIAQICSFLVFLEQNDSMRLEGILGALLGVCFFVISKVSREAVGYGDSWIVFLLGLAFGVKNLLWILAISSCLCAMVSLFLLLARKWKKEHRLPFVPFLWMGYLGVMLV